MCGINGFTWQDRNLLRSMHAATRHRGPDDEGFFEAPGISFRQSRLSIIDLSPAGHQPMSTQDQRFTIIFNGEIYNYQELRRELERLGERFRSTSDTEVLLAAFARWGEACLPKLNGIFAFAIWDREERRLTLVRDHVGVKPLYYAWDGEKLIFSSEIKAILVHDVAKDIDTDALNQYFRYLYVPGPRTMFRSIRKLPAGHVATFHDGVFDVRSWWSLKEGNTVASYNEAVEGVRQRVKDAVKRQLVSDRPLGVFLSGGIDSSAVLGIMAEIATGPIRTFSVGYESSAQAEKYNADARLAELTAKHVGAEHRTFILSAEEAAADLETVAWHMDEPVANHVQSSTFLLAKSAKPHITVALGGDGGDELFGGYSRYWYSRTIDRVRSLPLGGETAAALALLVGKPDLAMKFGSRAGLERQLAFVAQKEGAIGSFLKKDLNRPDAVGEPLGPVFSSAWRDATNQLMAADVRTWIPDESLIRTDRLTMAHGLEERVPLLDPELVAYASRVPSRFKLKNRRQGKRVFIDAMRPYLPPHVLNQEKRGWMSPMAKWIRGPLLPRVREILSPTYADTTAYLDLSAANRILDDHVSMKEYALNTIWSIVAFQLWWRRFMQNV
ncbi:asparagine synthase (glutamine-hydrolyzing) [Patescibacteria group bacterium]|nr:asparagine synthase (glutamine-hydrolyzing) [Patescibacteria group bacterium]MBU1448560.1 asparagine synthase (glutamine-hydrolyzing) [Patescibacteria group bacterium]MBU2613194.1 asparagine synthase (glutamine-hydrolyzing) [Patescibacteria group bacterium]